MFVGKFEAVIPLNTEEQKEAIGKLVDYLESGEVHQYTNYEVVLLKTIEAQQKEIEQLQKSCQEKEEDIDQHITWNEAHTKARVEQWEEIKQLRGQVAQMREALAELEKVIGGREDD